MAHARRSKTKRPALSAELEVEFSELREKSRVCREQFSFDVLSELKIALHRVKASARVHGSLDWERLLHQMEEGVAICETLHLEKTSFFGDLLSMFERSMEQKSDLVSGPLAELARLSPELATIRKLLAATAGSGGPVGVSTASAARPIVSGTRSSERLQETLVTAQRLRTLMNRVSREFTDESFPRDALNLIERIHEDITAMIDVSQEAEAVLADDLVESIESLILSLGAEFGYSPEFHAEIPDGMKIPKPVFQAIRHSTVQFVRNSFAHGFDPAQVAPEIKISFARLANGDIQFHYQDRGRGIDISKLEKRADDIAAKMGTQRFQVRSPLDLIFIDGVSTSESVTELAGRGVGMSVVAAEVKNAGGIIDLRSELGSGTEFCLTFARRGVHG